MRLAKVSKMLALPAFLLGAAALYIHYGEYLNSGFLRQHSGTVHAYYQESPLAVIALFTLFCTLYISAALPAGQLTPIAAGLFFGYVAGVAITVICYAVGPMFTFLLSRHCIGNALQRRYAAQLKNLNREFEKNGAWYLFVARQLPITPFFLINLLMGLTTLTLPRYFWINLISLCPNILLAPYLGTLLAEVENYGDLVSLELWAGIALITILPALLAKLVISRVRRPRP